MKVRIIDQPVKVFSEADSHAISLTELPVGSEVELGGVKKKDGKTWVGVTLANDQKGFIPGDARIFQIKQAFLNQGNVNVYSEPSNLSAVKAQFKKKTRFFLTGTVNQDNQAWVKIRDLSGLEGFIEPKTRITVIHEAVKPTKAIGRKNMLYGALWFIGGTLITIITYFAAASRSGSYLVTWVPLSLESFSFCRDFFNI